MKAKLSKFLLSNKSLLQELVNDLSEKFKYVSLLGTDTVGTKYSVSVQGSGVNDSNWKERGFVVRVFNGVNYSEYSFNSLEDFDAIKARIINVAVNDVKVLVDKGFKLMDFPLIEDEGIIKDFSSRRQT